MPDTTGPFDTLIGTLETLLDPRPQGDRPPDAIDRILAQPARNTQARSLREDPVVARLREDLTNGLIRIDTANAMFRLVARVLDTHMGA